MSQAFSYACRLGPLHGDADEPPKLLRNLRSKDIALDDTAPLLPDPVRKVMLVVFDRFG